MSGVSIPRPRLSLPLACFRVAAVAGLIVAWHLVGALGGAAAGEPTDFLRFVDLGKGEGRLETATASYQGPEGVTVDLIGVIHVADKAYYDGLEKSFAQYDELLYEMVKPKDLAPDEVHRSGSPVSMFQRGLKDVLGLEFQLDGIDYKQPNFVHADLDPETFERLQKEKNESLLGLMFKLFLKGLAESSNDPAKQASGLDIILAFASSDSDRALRYTMAKQMQDMEKVLAGVEEGTEGGSVIIVERNKAALAVLEAGIKAGKKKFGIFYGAGHMQDMEKRLVEDLGFKKTGDKWLTAWDIRRKAKPKRKPQEPAPGAPAPAGEGSKAGEGGKAGEGSKAGEAKKPAPGAEPGKQ